MRIVALIFGLLGTVGSGFIGQKWMSDPLVSENKERLKALYEKFKDLPPNELTNPIVEAYRRSTTYPMLFAAAGLGLVGCVLVTVRKGMLAALVFLVAFAVPMALYQKAPLLIFTGSLAVAGLLSIFVRSGTPYRKPRRGDYIPDDTDLVG